MAAVLSCFRRAGVEVCVTEVSQRHANFLTLYYSGGRIFVPVCGAGDSEPYPPLLALRKGSRGLVQVRRVSDCARGWLPSRHARVTVSDRVSACVRARVCACDGARVSVDGCGWLQLSHVRVWVPPDHSRATLNAGTRARRSTTTA